MKKTIILMISFLVCYSMKVNSMYAIKEVKSNLDCPIPIYPRGGYIPLLPKFDWADVKGANCYHLQVSLLPNFTVNIIDVIVTESSYQVMVPLLPLSIFNWRVSTGDGSNFGTFCWVSSFITGYN